MAMIQKDQSGYYLQGDSIYYEEEKGQPTKFRGEAIDLLAEYERLVPLEHLKVLVESENRENSRPMSTELLLAMQAGANAIMGNKALWAKDLVVWPEGREEFEKRVSINYYDAAQVLRLVTERLGYSIAE